MIRFFCTFGFALVAAAATAQSVKLSGTEVSVLLSGNTAVGRWEGVPYRQYFGDDGSTIYAQQGAQSARGQWRVQDDEYQSIWPGEVDWEGWFVMEFAGDWFWVSKTTPPTPFKVVEGEQLVEK